MHNGQQERIRLNGIDCPKKRRWMDAEEKVTKLLKAFKVSEAMHAQLVKSARRHLDCHQILRNAFAYQFTASQFFLAAAARYIYDYSRSIDLYMPSPMDAYAESRPS